MLTGKETLIFSPIIALFVFVSFGILHAMQPKEGYKKIFVTLEVVKVYGCSNASSGFLFSRDGYCKVLFDDNTRGTIKSPTGVGDVVKILREVKNDR